MYQKMKITLLLCNVDDGSSYEYKKYDAIVDDFDDYGNYDYGDDEDD